MENHYFNRYIIYFYGSSIPWRTVSHNQMVIDDDLKVNCKNIWDYGGISGI